VYSAFNLPHGGPGSHIWVEGDGFGRNEEMQVYWGPHKGLSEGLALTDYCGNLEFQFDAPTNATPGKYPVALVRAHTVLMKIFTILPPKITSTPGIHSGQSVQIQLSGFLASEYVTVSWNANGGQQLARIGVGDGEGSTTITPPPAPGGDYTLTAVGETSGFQATTDLKIGPGILLTPNPSNPGSTITVSGGGYTPGETVDVYFQTKQHGIVTATVDESGNFTVPLTIPTTYTPGANHYVYAVSTSGTDQARALFNFTTPSLDIYAYGGSYYNKQVTLYCEGFAANEKVDIFWNYQQPGRLKVGSATAASDGSFYIYFNIPSDPNLPSVAVAAIGTVSKVKAINYTNEIGAIIIDPETGPAGTKVHVKGGGFGGVETVTVSFNGTNMVTATSDASGAFKATFAVPKDLKIGRYQVQATGSSSGVSLSTIFMIPPSMSITPTTGPSGTVITVTGKRYSHSNSVDILWNDPNYGGYTYLGSANTSPKGTFTTTVTAPSGIISGLTYDVIVIDGPTRASAQAPFIAQ